MVNSSSFKKNFIEAVERSAVEQEHVTAMNEAKATLKQDFEREFGKEAFNQYYLGKVKVRVHSDYNYGQEGVIPISAPEPKIQRRDFKISFPHAEIADEFGVNFVQLHGSKFQPYFMAAALKQITHEPIYDELAGDLLDEVIEGIQNNIRDGEDPLTHQEYGPLTERQLGIIINALSDSINCMVEHRRPNLLRVADTIDPMSEDENPGPRPH